MNQVREKNETRARGKSVARGAMKGKRDRSSFVNSINFMNNGLAASTDKLFQAKVFLVMMK